MSSPAAAPEFLKGHGTENDFVLLPDPDDVRGFDAYLERYSAGLAVERAAVEAL